MEGQHEDLQRHIHLIFLDQEGDTCNCARTSGLMAESVYGGDIQSIDTDH